LHTRIKYTRKIYASWLRQVGGLPSETVDSCQGRIPKTVFAKSYLTVEELYREKILEAVHSLQKKIVEERG
jgi:intergrase/recombinase